MDKNLRQNRIKEISKEISALTQELERLLVQEESESESETATTAKIQVGDRVIITNNHLGLCGSEGTVVRVTHKQYQGKLDSGSFINRRKENVMKK